MREPSQVDRLVKAARSYRGVCRIDFQAPTIDGWKPILNFPGRLYDAQEAGYSFEVIGRRGKCKVFRLLDDSKDCRDGVEPLPSPSPVPAGSLFDTPVGKPQRPHWQEEAA